MHCRQALYGPRYIAFGSSPAIFRPLCLCKLPWFVRVQGARSGQVCLPHGRCVTRVVDFVNPVYTAVSCAFYDVLPVSKPLAMFDIRRSAWALRNLQGYSLFVCRGSVCAAAGTGRHITAVLPPGTHIYFGERPLRE